MLGIADSNQQIGLFDDQNGFYVGFTGVDFCIAKRKEGVDTIVTQTNFNRDKLDGTGYSGFTADLSKNNVFKISFGYLGAAVVVYEILRQDGVWITFHVIEYPNSSTGTHISNPVLPVTCRVEKTAGATNVILRTSSWSAGTIVGDDSLAISNRPWAINNNKTLVAGNRTSILTLKCSTMFAGLTNRIPMQVVYVAGSVDASKNGSIQLFKNATVSNTSFHYVSSGDSVAQYDIVGTTVTGGTLMLPIHIPNGGAVTLGTADFRLLVLPGETITFQGLSTQVNTTINAGTRWLDKF